ncbi:hypothetical protein CFOL_v3_11421 [Cephalotus follicularis]|uniref:Uncharacterized protein n=1 Tax=Cephalotus follicularis TaxID=3775 RepID=A0A1Q3BJ19_CEPFO|nr:hypothetical protein CFOL_v3_11421 [Cephalotus follicularis]
MSEEELIIRGELENDVERNLEEEIKDGIHHLALRLHRLYQHKNERNARQVYETSERRNKALCEVNVSIKMEGETRIEIKETKKEARQKGWPLSEAMLVNGTKKFDWAKSTLRSGSSGVASNTKNDTSHKAKMLISNKEHGTYARRNLISASRQRKGNLSVDPKLLQPGWKY